MGLVKQSQIIEEEKQAKNIQKIKDGYEKKIRKERTFSMYCPYCNGALSNEDVKKDQCLHCKHDLKWKFED